MAGLDDLAKAVSNAMNQRLQQSRNQSLMTRGQVNGRIVSVAGKSYPYSVAVDMSVSSGDWVWVVIYNNVRAVVVGR